jgi:hypothetical protein
MFQHCFIKFCPHKSLSFNVFRLHITNNYDQDFTIDKIVHMTSHSSLLEFLFFQSNQVDYMGIFY